jgi:hypothetical protein
MTLKLHFPALIWGSQDSLLFLLLHPLSYTAIIIEITPGMKLN